MTKGLCPVLRRSSSLPLLVDAALPNRVEHGQVILDGRFFENRIVTCAGDITPPGIMIRRIPRLARPDLVFSAFGSTVLLGADVPFVAVVYDLQHDVFPRFFPPALVEQRRADVVEIAEEAAEVACISESLLSKNAGNHDSRADVQRP